jgi:hypothetical protein
MYESLDKDSDLYKFLTKYLLQPLEGNCPICLNLEMPNKIEDFITPIYYITDKKVATEKKLVLILLVSLWVSIFLV